MWLDAFSAQALARIPAFENEDFGLTIAALAAMGHPMDASWLQAFVQQAQRKLYSMSGDGLAFTIWGLGVYGVNPVKPEKWWSRYATIA